MKFTLSLEEAGVVEGVGWMNYFLVIFIALPLALLLTVKVTHKTCLDIYLLLAFPGDIQQDGTRQKRGNSKMRIIVLDISDSVDIAFLRLSFLDIFRFCSFDLLGSGDHQSPK